MGEPVRVSRRQIINRIREAGWCFKRKAKMVEIWMIRGTPRRMNLPTKNSFPVSAVGAILSQAGLNAEEIEAFLKESIKEAKRP